MFSLSNASSPSAVSTKGTLVEAKNFGSDNNSYTVNGVTFSPKNNLLGWQYTGTNPGKVTGDAGLDAILNSKTYALGHPTVPIQIHGLQSGHEYEVQFFIADNRASGNCCGNRTNTIRSGGSQITTEGIGTPQLVTARFVATGSSITFDLSGSEIPQLNAWQVRDLSGGGKKTVTLPATAAWFDTEVDVPSGAKLMIKATGTWRNAEGGTPVGPNGFGGDPLSGSTLDTVSFASLIGRIGKNGAPFFVGESFEQKASDTGRLFLQMNDTVGNVSDNSGELEVNIEAG